MSEEIPIRVQIDGREAIWKMLIEGDGPWHLSLQSANGVESTAFGNNVFEALRSIRTQLFPRRIIICCNGARANVRPSALSASHGAWMIYTLHMWRPSTVRDLAPTLSYAPPSKIGSVEEQDAYWERHLRNRKNWLNFINPVWWIYFLTDSWGKPKWQDK
ncbi:hypothetical protein SGFS_045900 [Streptomyces graminofaciens]|uniref:Uncharacterized protein n=1 Tax=Streptomyces graminofaciens TaxID=68212 RepID=A0ABM7FBB9_9ACTN|nr:hypothetical protein [Streptomyces graminofaciens]BBC33296.1 hypothetical protein SGFS_045900 [Streptomyces graminofaciens]